MRYGVVLAAALGLALVAPSVGTAKSYGLSEELITSLQIASLEGVDALVAAVPQAIAAAPFQAAGIVCYAAGLQPDAVEQIAAAASSVAPDSAEAINECVADLGPAPFAQPPLENLRQNAASPF